jgi:hypothetical protein
MSNKQASFSTILSNNDESNNIHELPGQNMLDDVVLNVSSPPPLTQEEINNILKNQTDLSEMTECPVSHKKGNISSCPFMNSQNKDLRNTKFEYHYEVPLPETIQDFRFNITNYSKEGIENSKILRNMPRHLRNTIFIKNDKVEQLRKREFPVLFLLCEEMKEKAYKLYESKKYIEALNLYNVMYSLFKWVVIKDPKKREAFLTNYDFKEENNLYDKDIEIRRINTNKENDYEESGFKAYLINILKGICYCYMNMRHYSEAVKCMDEAMSYVLVSRGEVLFRRAQAIMYNKFSELKELNQAHADLCQAKMFKKIELINEHMKDLENLIKEKKYRKFANVKSLFNQTNYAMNVITTKNLDVRDHIYHSYDDIYFGAKIVEEMKDTFSSSIKFFQGKLKEKKKEKNNINKSEKDYKEFLEDYDKFYDFYNEYSFYINLTVLNLDKEILDKLDDNDRETIKQIKKNETMNLLFKDFRLKKAQEIYDNMDWNMTIWKFCFDTVSEREKKLKEEQRKKNKDNKLTSLKKLISNPLSNTQHAIATFLFAIITLLTIGLYAMYFNDKYNQDLK